MGPWYILASEKECIIDPGDPGCYHYSDVMMNVIPFQISGVSIVQAFVPAQIKRNIKAPRHWLLWGEFSSQRATVTRKRCPFDDVLMIKP